MVAIVGPTASGKSRLGMELALRLGLPIFCCDSVQVYRGLDIGSAKPTLEDQQRAPHHLLDLVGPGEEFSAGDYARAAHALIESGGPGLFVGGTGFYLRASLLSQSGDDPAAEDRAARAAFTDTWTAREEAQPGVTHAELTRIDAETAASVHPRNLVRALRALWLCHVHERPVSQVRREDPPRARLTLFMITLDPGVDEVDAAIETRCDAMLAAGWIREVENLLAAGYDAERKAMRSLGYRQLVAHLRGQMTLDEARGAIKRETRRYARRQRTYFRHQIKADMSVRIQRAEDCPWGQIETFLNSAPTPLNSRGRGRSS